MPLKDSDGKIYGVLGTYIDITDRKQAEIALEARAKELEDLNKLMVGRELKMTALKKENEDLRKKLESL